MGIINYGESPSSHFLVGSNHAENNDSICCSTSSEVLKFDRSMISFEELMTDSKLSISSELNDMIGDSPSHDFKSNEQSGSNNPLDDTGVASEQPSKDELKVREFEPSETSLDEDELLKSDDDDHYLIYEPPAEARVAKGTTSKIDALTDDLIDRDVKDEENPHVETECNSGLLYDEAHISAEKVLDIIGVNVDDRPAASTKTDIESHLTETLEKDRVADEELQDYGTWEKSSCKIVDDESIEFEFKSVSDASADLISGGNKSNEYDEYADSKYMFINHGPKSLKLHQYVSACSKRRVQDKKFKSIYIRNAIFSRNCLENMGRQFLKKLFNAKVVVKNLDSSKLSLKKKLQMKVSNSQENRNGNKWLYHCMFCQITYRDEIRTTCSACSRALLYQCNKCEKLFVKYRACFKHVQRKCFHQDVLNCNECSYSTYHKSDLIYHFQINHLKECHKCRKKLKNIKNLNQHMKTCGQQPKLKCKYCLFRTVHKKCLKSHILRFHDEQYIDGGKEMLDEDLNSIVFKSF